MSIVCPSISLSGLLVLLSAVTASASTIDHRFWYNYNTQVYDWSGNTLHGTKPAIGGPTAVNTPYGLYLKEGEVSLYGSTGGKFNDANFNLQLFMRYLPGKPGTAAREILTFGKSTTISKQFRQQSAPATSSPVFELETSSGTSAASGSYALSKA
jgi:hypothetical protein